MSDDLYQSPMGKVKTYTEKEIRTLAVYQSPMGKVKNNILCCAFSIHHKYSFVNRFCAFLFFYH